MTSGERTYSLIGGTIWGNRGAEAMTCAAIARVRDRDPNARFNIFSYYPRQDRDLIRDDAIAVVDGGPIALIFVIFPFALLDRLARLLRLKWPRMLMPDPARRLADSDALLDVQGISFDDGRLLFLPYKILSVLPAVFFNVPVYKLSQAMGPFDQRSNRLAAKVILPLCRRVFPRGEITAAALDRIGLRGEKYSFAPDVAFAFEPGDSLSKENDDHVVELLGWMGASREAGKTVVTLAPSTVVLKKMEKSGLDYIALLATVVSKLLERDISVLVFPNANRKGVAKPRNNDFYVINLLRERLIQDGQSLEQVRFVEEDINYDSILQLVGRSDFLLSSRFHGMVAGLSKIIPTMVIGWSHKYAEVLSLFNIEHMSTDYAKAVKDTDAMLAGLIADTESIRVAIGSNLNRVKSQAVAQIHSVVDDVKSH